MTIEDANYARGQKSIEKTKHIIQSSIDQNMYLGLSVLKKKTDCNLTAWKWDFLEELLELLTLNDHHFK